MFGARWVPYSLLVFVLNTILTSNGNQLKLDAVLNRITRSVGTKRCTIYLANCDAWMLNFTANSSPNNTLNKNNFTLDDRILIVSAEACSIPITTNNTSRSAVDLKLFVPRFYKRCLIVITPIIVRNLLLNNKDASIVNNMSCLYKQIFINLGHDYFIFLNMSPSLLIRNKSETVKHNLRRIKRMLFLDVNETFVQLSYTFCLYCLPKDTVQFVNLEETSQSKERYFPNHFSNLQNYVFRVTLSNGCSKQDEETITKNWREFYFLRMLGQKLNFSFHFIEKWQKFSYGVPTSNGAWSGIVGHIVSGHADLSGAVAMTWERNSVLEFTSSLFYIWLTFTTGGHKIDKSWDPVILRTFDQDSWRYLSFTFLGFAFVWTALKKISASTNNSIRKSGNSSAISFWQILEQMYFIFLGQPFNRSSRRCENTSAGVLVIIWSFACMIISTFFVSKLTQFLTCPLVTPPPSTFDELSLSDYAVEMHYTLKGGAGETYLSSDNASNVTKKLYEMSNRINESSSFVGCFLKGLISNRACIGYNVYVDLANEYYSAVTNNNLPGFTIAPDVNFFVPTCIVMEKGSVLPPVFSPYINHAVETGWPSHWRRLTIYQLKTNGICDPKLERSDIENIQQGIHQYSRGNSRDFLKLEELMSLKHIFTLNILLIGIAFSIEMLTEKAKLLVRSVKFRVILLIMIFPSTTNNYLP